MHPTVATALLLFGLFFLVAITSGLIRTYRSTKWPAVDGVIIESTVERKKTGKSWNYYPKVKYRFEVAGETFESERIASTATGMSLEAEAERAAHKFPEGSLCKVYFEPGNPSSCVLQTGLKAGDLIGLLVPVPFMAIGGYYLMKAIE
jgi:hypothetical protein